MNKECGVLSSLKTQVIFHLSQVWEGFFNIIIQQNCLLNVANFRKKKISLSQGIWTLKKERKSRTKEVNSFSNHNKNLKNVE